MIYLRPSRSVANAHQSLPILGGTGWYILDHDLDLLQTGKVKQSLYQLRIESEHGTELDKDGVEETVLHLRIFSREGVDLTDLLSDTFKPCWYKRGALSGLAELAGRGMSISVSYKELQSLRTTYSVPLYAGDILRALGLYDRLQPARQVRLDRVLCRGEIVLYSSSILSGISDTVSWISDTVNHIAGERHIYQDAYSVEAKTIGSPLIKSSEDKYIIQCAVHHTLTGKDYTDRIFDRPTPLIRPEWYRINPEGHDRKGITDAEWADNHRGMREVIITRDDFVTGCTVGYKIDRQTLVDTINNLSKI